MNEILFTRLQFDITGFRSHVFERILLDFPSGELSIQNFNYGGTLTSSSGIYLTEIEKDQLLPFINAKDFEPYRVMSENDEWNDPLSGYFDGVYAEFTGITNSIIPLIRFRWNVFHEKGFERPYELLYITLTDIARE